MKNLLLFSLLLLCQKSIAQLGDHFYGDAGDDFIAEMITSPDGNFYALGTKKDGTQKLWLMKLNPLGDVLWEKIYAPTDPGHDEHGFSVDLFADGSLLITGEKLTNETFPKREGLAMKTDASGNQIWKKIYEDVASLYDAKPAGNNILMGGWYDNTGSSDSGILLLTNGNGTVITRNEIKTANQNFVKKIIPTSDNHFIVAGRSNVIGVGYEGVFLQKVTPAGNAVWTITHDTGFDEAGFGINNTDVPHPLGVYVGPGDTIWVTNPREYVSDITLLKFLPDGSFADEKIFGSSSIREYPFALIPANDNGFIICGETDGEQAFAVKINASGNEQWRTYYDRDAALLTGYDVDENGQGYLISGRYQDNLIQPLNYDGWVLGIEKDGNPFPFTLKGKIIFDENKNCMADPGEPPLPGWFVNITSNAQSDINKALLLSDESGKFEYKFVASTNQLTLYNGDPNKWSICAATASVEINQDNPLDSVLFLVQPSGNCIAPEVSITQPDLIRCDTSCLTATVKNDSPEASEAFGLTIDLDEALHFTSISRPFLDLGQSALIQLGQLGSFETINTEICVSLDCDVQLGATHEIKARIGPSLCEVPYSGPRFNVHGLCYSGSVLFAFDNIGGGGKNASTTYSVYADGVIVAKDVFIKLPEADTSKLIFLPSDGRTWLVEVKPDPEDPHQEIISDAIEGCGKGKNGLHSISFVNGQRPNDEGPDQCILRIPNTIGVPNKISESTLGYGFYNFVTDTRRLEFSLRVKNPLVSVASEFFVDLQFSPSLELRSFRMLSSPGDQMITLIDSNSIRILYQDLLIEPGQTMMLKFSIQPKPGILPDDGNNSLFVITGAAYFDEQGPMAIEPGFCNYSQLVPTDADLNNQYGDEIKLYGGRNYDFGVAMAKGKDGTVFTCGESNSFGHRSNYDGFVIKLDKNGEVIWLTALDMDNYWSNTLNGIATLPDGGCIVSGNFWDSQLENYIENVRLYAARLDNAGKVIWKKQIAIPPDVVGAWSYGMIETGDHNFLIHGIARHDNSDQFYMKININGDILWSTFPNINGSYFVPGSGILLSDGGFVFVGTNQSTIIDADVYLEKISADGNILWSQDYNSQYGVYLGGIAESSSGDLMVCGNSLWSVNDTTYVFTPTLIKVTASGEVLWEKNPIPGDIEITEPNCIVALPNQDFLLGGNMLADTANSFDILVMKVTEEGEIVWYKNYGARNFESINDMLVYSPDEFLLWGFNQSMPPFYNLQSILLKTNGEGEISQVKENVVDKNEFGAFLFPNPAREEIHIVLSPEPIGFVRWIATDISGRILLSGKEFASLSMDIDLHALKPGLYFISFPGTEYPGCRIIVVSSN